MSTTTNLIVSIFMSLVIQHEGTVMDGDRHIAYKCTSIKTTVGYGRNLDDKGISQDEALMLLSNDINECIVDLMDIFDNGRFNSYTINIRRVLVDMRFALGRVGFRKFERFISAVKEEDKDKMVEELIDSNWYRGVGYNRLTDLINIIKHDDEEK